MVGYGSDRDGKRDPFASAVMAVAVVSRKTDKSGRRRLRLLLASVTAFTTCSFRNRYTVDRRSVCNKYRPKMYELALLTSLWVDSNRWRKHRVEVLKALSINVRNPHLSVIYVQLDGTDGEAACPRLMTDLEREYKVKPAHIGKFVCAYDGDVRLSYLRMFEIAKSAPPLQGHVVVLANGDMAFDDTIMKAKYVQTDTLLTIATRGLRVSWFWPNLGSSKRTPDRCYPVPKIRDSWDAYIFHPESLQLNKTLWLDMKTCRPFPMNQIWAEESALNAIHIASTSIEKIFQVCDEIYMWHLHRAPKTYDEAASDRVWHSSTIAADCRDTCECLGLRSNANRLSLRVWDYEYLPWVVEARNGSSITPTSSCDA